MLEEKEPLCPKYPKRNPAKSAIALPHACKKSQTWLSIGEKQKFLTGPRPAEAGPRPEFVYRLLLHNWIVVPSNILQHIDQHVSWEVRKSKIRKCWSPIMSFKLHY